MSQKRQWFALASMLSAHKVKFVLSALSGLANLGCGVATAATGGWIVGKVASGASASELTPLLILLGSLALAAAIFTWIESWLAHDLAYHVLARLREGVYEALARLAPANLVDERSGDVVSAAMADVETLEWFYAHTIGAVIICAITTPAILIVLGSFHPYLPLMLIPLLLIAGVTPGLLRKRAKAQGKHMREQLGELNAEVIDAVQGLRELTVFGAQERNAQRLENHGKKLIRSQFLYGLRAGLESSVTRGFTALGMLFALAFAAHLTTQGSLDPAHYPVTVILAGSVFGPVASLSAMAGQFGAISAAADRVFGLIHQEPEVSNPDYPQPAPEGPLTVHFDDVSFTYKDVDAPAVADLSFSIEPGESVALAGHSGAGKSTCARLLMRYYDPQAGRVTIGGRDIRQLKLQDLRSLIAPVPQDIYLFDRSMADNIRLGRPEATDREVEGAARLAAIHDFILSLPQGYQTPAGERGLKLSGGQRQRIAVARAFLSEAPILILDEASGNLDAENERALQQALDRLRQDRATLVIAHRLSTIENADRVIVLDQGRIVEQGPPAKLLASDGPLATLMHAQSQSRKDQ